jgi:ligand-binding sensor domain-containing protein
VEDPSLTGSGSWNVFFSRMNITKSSLVNSFQFLLGVAVVVALGFLIIRALPKPELPANWQIIRPPNNISGIVLNGDQVWVGSRTGLNLIDRTTGQILPLPANTPQFRQVTGLIKDQHDHIWVADISGVSIYVGGRWQPWEEIADLLPGQITEIFEDQSGNIWIGGEMGVARYDGDKITTYLQSDQPGINSPGFYPVNVIYQDQRRIMWFGSSSPTSGGLSHFDGENWGIFSLQEGLIHPAVNDIFEDNTGTFWLATGYASRGGAMNFTDGEWKVITSQDGLAGEKVTSLFQDQKGRIWFGSEYDGVAISENSGWRILSPKDGLSGREVKVIVQDVEGVYWIGTNNGITRILQLP